MLTNKYDEGYYRVAASWFRALDDGRKSNAYWAKVFNVDWSTVENWRRDGGKVNRYRVSPELLARAEKMINSGVSKRKVEQELHISRRTLGKRFPQSKLKPQRDPWVWAKELLEDGASYTEVGKTTSIPDKVLRETLPGYGWSIAEAADFSSAVHNAKKRMPKNVAQIFFGP